MGVNPYLRGKKPGFSSQSYSNCNFLVTFDRSFHHLEREWTSHCLRPHLVLKLNV